MIEKVIIAKEPVSEAFKKSCKSNHHGKMSTNNKAIVYFEQISKGVGVLHVL